MTPDLALTAFRLTQSVELALFIKVTLVLAVGLLVERLARRARASVRHLVLVATFVATLALPLAAAVGPAVVIGVPVEARFRKALTSATTVPSSFSQSPARATAGSDELRSSWNRLPGFSWRTLGLVFWIVGTAVVLLQLAFALYRLRWLRRSGLPWAEMREPVRSLAADAGVNRRVDVVLHEDVASPLTFGTRQPVVVVPRDARDWDEADVRRALVHELEHVRRGDWALQTAARAVSGIWWFHPLVWIAWRRLSLEAERACDDAVVAREEGMAYAEQLVSLAERLSAAQTQPTLGMANRSDLSARVSSVLDLTVRRGRPGAAAIVGTTVVVALAVAGVAPLRAVAVPAGSAAAAAAAEPASEQGRLQRRLDVELYEAAESGDVAGINELVKAGANVNASIAGDGSPLIGAVRSGQLTVVVLLLDRGANPNLGVLGDGSPLIVAAEEGRTDIVRLLLDRGANVDMEVQGDGNPLIAAAAEGHLDVVTLLLDRGASVDLVVPGDENPLIRAADEGRLEVVRALIRRGADVNARVWAEQGYENGRRIGEWRTPLNRARKYGHTAVVELLQSAGARE